MASRLDRLFILLDTGSSESIRLAAAKQLGEVQRVQPADLNYLLGRIKEYSSKSVWETRVAAGQAISCVLEQVSPWPPSDIADDVENYRDDKVKCRQQIARQIIEENIRVEDILNQFDLDKIISLCPPLLSIDATDTDDSDLTRPSTGTSRSRGSRRGSARGAARKKDSKEQLLRQRQLINKELGIAMVGSLNLGVKSTDIVSNDDLQTEYDASGDLSAARRFQGSQQDTLTLLEPCISHYNKISKILAEANCIHIPQRNSAPKDDTQGRQDESNVIHQGAWPLNDMTNQYSIDLFNPAWEIRHGAAIALREFVRLQGKSSGKRSDLPVDANELLNQIWLLDMALRSICVLALDKFGDFLFDQVVAPVRENAAQLLGCCIANLTKPNAHLVLKILIKMLDSPSWEVRHGGTIGLKYSLNAVEESFSKELLLECFDPIFRLLGDNVDDVSAEAAAALVPVKDLMIETIPDKTPKLIKFLWEHLADLDELTTSASNIVQLLASLITSSSTQLDSSELIKSIPRLWPLLGHSSTTVRVSVLRALTTLLKTRHDSCLSWMPEDLVTTSLRLIFQRAILENMEDVLIHIEEVWMLLLSVDETPTRARAEILTLLRSSSQYLNYWLCLTMQPFNAPIDRGSPMWLNIKPDGTPSNEKPDGEIYIGSCTFNADTMAQQKSQATKCRLAGVSMLGALYSKLVCDLNESQHSSETLKYLSEMFMHYIKTKSAHQRIYSGWALESWASYQIELTQNDLGKLKSLLPSSLSNQLLAAIQETTLCYDELAPIFTRLQQETRDFVAFLIESGIQTSITGTTNDKRAIYNLNQIQSLCDLNLESELTRVASKKAASQMNSEKTKSCGITGSNIHSMLTVKKNNLTKSLRSTNASQKSLSISVLSSLACAKIAWRLIPDKLTSVITPILDSIETETQQKLLDKSISYLVILFDLLCQEHPKYNALIYDILRRLIDALMRAVGTPVDSSAATNTTLNELGKNNGYESHRIILLDNLQRKVEQSRSQIRRQSSVASNSSMKRSLSISSSQELENDNQSSEEQMRQIQSYELAAKGSSLALNSLVKHFGSELAEKLPSLWRSITADIQALTDRYVHEAKEAVESQSQSEVETKLTKNLLLLETIGHSVDVKLRGSLSEISSKLIALLKSQSPMIRHRASQCLGVISKIMFNETIDMIKRDVLPLLELDSNILARCGSIEAVASIIEHLQLDLVPKIDMFIVCVLKRMSDQNDQVRLMATHCFGKLLSLMPLNLETNRKYNDNKNFSANEVLTSNDIPTEDDDQRFIEQLLNPKKLDKFEIPFKMNAELRSYQHDGLNWLSFLNRFNLHGILCDEMGLGKTPMTICIIASDHYTSSQNKTPDSWLPSLIVCPSTLTEHWLYEIVKFVPAQVRSVLNPVAYYGNSNDRAALRGKILASKNETTKASHRLVITSYDIIRNDIDFFKEIQWDYCVLDEGHIIKNGKTKLSRAIRLLSAKHRLILSGTPIQNNVTELWSLFDFLMPGFLGSERQFNARYAKPILQSRELKCSSRDLEAGALAMESLHRQVLPFILRRLKEDVLDDLPPKIIQDYYCELSPLQQKLYEDFTRSRLCQDVTKKSLDNLIALDSEDQPAPKAEASAEAAKADSRSHVFQALQYLKNVCNHPKLVLTAKHSQYSSIKKSLDAEKSSLDDISHSSKLKALKQLLIDCGIGAASPLTDENQQQSLTIESVVNQHRALVFCQIRSMVDIIENDLFKKHLPGITYLKLDGSVPANQRHSIVSRFNDDPSIDILLLTTQIGGLGLNLTGADTVIFVEHDWNPTKDLQAMDRAHRIGQKKVVNVYRLITKATLEEKIMGLQKFKTMVSNTVINQDNAGLGTMNVDHLFDLFDDAAQNTTTCGSTSASMGVASSKRSDKTSSFVDLLPELWDQQQYETEYDLTSFVSSLKPN